MAESNPYQVIIEEDIGVPTRDGIRLSADVYHPAQAGRILEQRLPVLIERTPYGKRDPIRRERARFFARHGYVVVLQDCRGCNESEGTFYFLIHEPKDGYDTVEWIARQPWCDGKVATFGASYGSWFQGALATQAPPHLAGMFPMMGGWNAHTSAVRQGGALELRWLAWAFFQSAHNFNKELKSAPWVNEALNRFDLRDLLTRMPLRRGETPLKLVPNYEQWLFDLFTHGEYDDYWKQPGFAMEEFREKIPDVPMYFCGGWYDSYTRSVLEAFTALSSRKKGAAVKLLMGPWSHGTYTPELTYAGDADFGPDAAIPSVDGLHVRWYDRWLKGAKNGIEESAPVRIFIMGGGSGKRTKGGRIDHGGCWRDEQEWPLARTRYAPFYLHGDGTLRQEAPVSKESRTSYLFDPRNPVPTIGGNFSSLKYVLPPPPGMNLKLIPGIMRRADITPAGPFDQRENLKFFGCRPPYMPLSSRPDVLVFQTPLLDQDVEVTGPIEVKLWISSTARDTDFTAKIIDLCPPNEDYPEGYALNLSDSIMRARYWRSWSEAELLEPGRVYPLTITLYPTSNLFKRGHRIRVDISSSNFPRFDVNPNTGEPLGMNRETMSAENTIYHDSDRPSQIVLPVIPA